MRKATPSDLVYAPPSAYHLGVSHGTKQDEHNRKARQAFRKEERLHQSEQRVVDEKRRHAGLVKKIKRLRELRLARDAGRQEASAARKP
jgi:hypothetical protein